MELNIAGEQVFVTVPFSSQDFVRRTEQDIEALYRDWRLRFTKKTPTELLAMMIYQYASYYHDMRDKYDRATREAENISRMLDSVLDKSIE